MGAPADTSLTLIAKLTFATQYKRTDLPINSLASVDNIQYGDISEQWTNGSGEDKCNLQHYSRRRLITTSEQLNLDGGLLNNWAHILNYDAVKFVIIRNRETSANRFITVTFKDERYRIGPGGARVIIEPSGPGIEAVIQSESEEEGLMTVTSNADVTYDLIILGSSKEASSSSG